MKPNRRLPTWKILGLFGTALLLLALACWLWISTVIDRKWAAMERRLAEIPKEIELQVSCRRILEGELQPGNAWDDYTLAVAELGKRRNLHRIRRGYAHFPYEFGPLREELDASTLVLEHWRRGIRRGRAEWNPGSFRTDDDLNNLRYGLEWLGQLSSAYAQKLAGEGRAGEGMKCFLDTAQFGQDLADTPWIDLSHSMYEKALSGIRESLTSRTLARETLQSTERALAILESSFPRFGRSLLSEARRFGEFLLREDPYYLQVSIGETRVPYEPGWRHAFSMRLMKADAFLEYDRCVRLLSTGEAQPWNLAKTGMERLWDSRFEGHNEVVGFSREIELMMALRGTRTRLRLLIMAAHCGTTREILELNDPYGDRLKHAKSEGKIRFWSLGRDGIDNGGVGGWTESWAEPEGGKDLVLEVERDD